MTKNFYTPLSKLLEDGSEEFMFGPRPSSFDALMYGYLIFHLVPVLPDPTLRNVLTESFPGIVRYLERCHKFFTEYTVESKIEEGYMSKLVQGWGKEVGKRKEDFIGLGAMLGSILIYSLWCSIRRSH